MMFGRTTVAALAVAIQMAGQLAFLGASVGEAVAQADKPFALTCEGRLISTGSRYILAEGEKPLNANPKDNLACAHVTIAERSTGAEIQQSLREDTIRQLRASCTVGQSCKVSGSVLNLSHDVFVYVKIDSISRE
jgi:hypothetical protein